MRRILGALATLALLFCAGTARAQSVRIPADSYGYCYALTVPQTISASCTVTVYDAGTTNLSTGLFRDAALAQPLTSPFAAATNGSWLFYVASSSTQAYDIRLSGGNPAITPYTIANVQPGAGGGGGGNVKPASSAGIVFVSLQGNDSNDCLSWGSSCVTILGAYNKLSTAGGTIYVTSGLQTGGPQCTPTSGQGLAFAGPADPGYASMPELIGSTYWVKAKGGFAGVTISGVSATNSNNNSTVPAVTPLSCGGAAAPAFQTSNVTGYTWENISLFYPKQGFLLNIDSTGSATGTSSSSSDLNIINTIVNICNSCGATPGPTIWIGGNVIWVKLDNLSLQGNPNNATPEGRAAILYQTNGGLASGLIHMTNINSTGAGNFVWENDHMSGTGGFDITNWTMEGANGINNPVIDVRGGTSIFFGAVTFPVASDAGLAPIVHVPASLPPYTLRVYGPYGQDAMTIDGPADLAGEMRQGGISAVAFYGSQGVATVAPQALRETGYPLGRLTNIQTDVNRRSFLSTLARFTNLASQLPAAWTTTSGFASITPGQTAPDGTTNAAIVTTSTNGGAIAYSATPTYGPGDYLYMGVWARMSSTAGINSGGIADSSLCLCFPFGSNPTIKVLGGSYNASGGSTLSAASAPQTDGEWQWLWAIGKVTGGLGSSGTQLRLNATASTTPMEFYAPVFVKLSASTLALVAAPTFSSASETGNIVTMVTTGAHGLSPGEPLVISGCSVSGYNGEITINTTPLSTSFTYYVSGTGLTAPTSCVITPGNDSEAADWAQNTGTWAENAPAGTLAGPRGLEPSFGGSTNFWGTLNHANTANRVYTFPDAAITVAGDLNYACGPTTTCADTTVISPRTFYGRVTLTSASPSTATVTGISPAFTSTTSYQCVLTDMTDATKNLLKVVNTSTSSFTITGPNTITDVISYICEGN